MDSDTQASAVEELDLVDSLNREWLKLPWSLMQSVGPAAQTFGGFLKITNKETFAAISKIAKSARLPKRTVEKHLDALEHKDWLSNRGRQCTRLGRPRRTCTWTLTQVAKDSLDPYGFLPWWACSRNGDRPTLSWSCRAVLSIVMGRLLKFKAAVDQQVGSSTNREDVWGSIENMGGDDRFKFSLDLLQQSTGLTRDSVVSAKRELRRMNIIHWYGDAPEEGSQVAHRLVPNQEFRVRIKASETPGYSYVEYLPKPKYRPTPPPKHKQKRLGSKTGR